MKSVDTINTVKSPFPGKITCTTRAFFSVYLFAYMACVMACQKGLMFPWSFHYLTTPAAKYCYLHTGLVFMLINRRVQNRSRVAPLFRRHKNNSQHNVKKTDGIRGCKTVCLTRVSTQTKAMRWIWSLIACIQAGVGGGIGQASR